ncbi:MAG: cytochrome c3 family protein [Magnetococcales bacterium]|nr:cytochrome c3 family protein [Magnetococcales bacterium]
MYGHIRMALVLLSCLLLTRPALAQVAGTDLEPIPVTPDTGNVRCLACHGEKGFATPLGTNALGERKKLYVDQEALKKTVHGERRCVECHTDVTTIPHKAGVKHRVDCVGCHSELKKNYRDRGKGWDREVVAKVMRNIGLYMDSVHAIPGKEDPSRPVTYCTDCHRGHDIHPKGSPEREQFLLDTPRICGRCHSKQLADYEESVHGVAALRLGDKAPAVCADCHTAHAITRAHEDPAKLAITKSCGSCHEAQYQSYTATYHGQINVLGFTHTAKCFDCHESHLNRRVNDPRSKVNGANRKQTCLRCHAGVSPGFLTFLPHGNTHDFERYPEMWLASKAMIGLLVGVFLFFWTHSALWFYRERQERLHLIAAGHPVSKKVCRRRVGPPGGPKGEDPLGHVQRFSWVWRLFHLCFALSIMTLAFTGITVMYADAFWAPLVAKVFGGAKVMAVLHRSAALVFAGVFFIHLTAVFYKILWRDRKTFRWFGPDSLVPNLQDLQDFMAMLRWFFGKGPRPLFDRWTYWEKFDYWAPFWGMFIIGASGLVLWFPRTAGEYLPGWIFNVATIVHGEEAFLAIVFIFSVHFFNCHFRPSKFPLDIMMFVGRMPLEEFKEERPVEYRRLAATGALRDRLTAAPSPGLKRYSRMLGYTLLTIGVTLLFMALTGVGGHLLQELP